MCVWRSSMHAVHMLIAGDILDRACVAFSSTSFEPMRRSAVDCRERIACTLISLSLC